jgi:GAF domain-containing protein
VGVRLHSNKQGRHVKVEPIPEQPEHSLIDLRTDGGARSQSTLDLIRALLPRVDELYGVPEAAAILVSDIEQRIGVERAAVLIPDEGRWRVAAGLALRSLEHRYELLADSWLVQQVARDRKGLLIEHSDIARVDLRGAPLAAARHLLAVPVPYVSGIVLAARDGNDAFTEQDLADAASIGESAGSSLAAACDTRTLARSLAHLCDYESLAALPKL